jgi:hypothetical protein
MTSSSTELSPPTTVDGPLFSAATGDTSRVIATAAPKSAPVAFMRFDLLDILRNLRSLRSVTVPPGAAQCSEAPREPGPGGLLPIGRARRGDDSRLPKAASRLEPAKNGGRETAG